MLTRMYYKSFAAMLSGYDPSNFTIVNHAGNSTTSNSLGSYWSFFNNMKTFCTVSKGTVNKASIAFGDGTKAPTLDDYQLSGNHLVNYSASLAKTFSDDGTTNFIYTITNAESTEFTIREVGVYSSPYSSNSNTLVLMYRELLDEPITIPAGGVGQVTVTFKSYVLEA